MENSIDFFTPFIILFTLVLLLGGGIIFWALRLAEISVYRKILILLVYVTVVVYMPYQIMSILGFPAYGSYQDLPDAFRIAAYVAHDDQHYADVLVVDVQGKPRLMRLKLNNDLLETLGSIDFCKNPNGKHFRKKKLSPLEVQITSNRFDDFFQDGNMDYVLPPKEPDPHSVLPVLPPQ